MEIWNKEGQPLVKGCSNLRIAISGRATSPLSVLPRAANLVASLLHQHHRCCAMDSASLVLSEGLDPSQANTYVALSKFSKVPYTTLWHRAHGRPSIDEKARDQQYLTPSEEEALVKYLLRMSRNGFPIPVKYLRSLAFVIACQRSSIFQAPPASETIRPPGKNWPQAFYKRHPELKSRRVKALDWNRHDQNICEKTEHWFDVVGPEINRPDILPENVYNMDETGVMLSMLGSLKVLVGKDDLRTYRGAGIKRTMVTAIECISADGRSLHSLIIWPAATHRSTWTTHPTPGWHFACSQSGYTDSKISFDWLRLVFDPQTRLRAGGRPRMLICDGFGTHESLEILKYCFENNIVLCRIPSHTSHTLQPCDVGVFGPLKTAYREQIERLYRGGANTVGKQHFTSLYSRAREQALTARNIKSGWSKTGLYPFSPHRVLKDIQKPLAELRLPRENELSGAPCNEVLQTPVTSEALTALHSQIDQGAHALDESTKYRLQKLAKAAQKSIAERDLLLDENRLLFEQNNESNCRKSVRSTKVGEAKVMSYSDIVAAQAKRDAKETAMQEKKRGTKRKSSQPKQAPAKRTRKSEVEAAQGEIEAMGLGTYCTVLAF